MRNYLMTRRNFFDDAWTDFFKPVSVSCNNMRTDIKEVENGYEMNIEMPGFDKSEVDIELKNGYLNIAANKEEKEENKDKFVSREIKTSYSRSYYVGDVREENIKAKYDNGILTISIPKKADENNKILIE